MDEPPRLITCKRIRMTLSDAPAGVVEVVAKLHALVGREPGTGNLNKSSSVVSYWIE